MLKKKLNAKAEARLNDLIRRGHALEQRQLLDEAAAEYRKVLEIAPGNIDACQLLGMLLHKRGENELAEPLLAKVVKVRTRQADLQCAYGAILGAIGEHRKAIVYYRKALELDPGYVIAQYNLGQELMYLGETKAAIAAYQRAIEIQPLCAPAYQQLARLCKFTEYNDDVRIMEQLYGQFTGAERMLLAFALSVVHKKLGNYEQSFDYLLEGNRLQRATLNYSPAETEATVRELSHAYSAEILARTPEPVDSDLTPIFIVGMPRSGTSLAEQILASHSQVHGCGELQNIGRIHRSTFSATSHLGTQVANISPEQRRKMAQRYLGEIAEMAGGKPYATDKMPHNFLHVGLISYIFPNARIIHCERHPLDTCLSIFSNLFTGLHPYAYQLEELGHYYLHYQKLMAHWQEVLPDRIYTLNYERVVADTDHEVRGLLDFCGLQFEEACLSFFENERAVTTVSSTQVRQPIYTSSVEGWRRYEQGLAPLRAVLGV